MAVDIQKMFNEELPAAIDGDPDAAKAIGATYQMKITGDGGGEWFIDCTDKGPSCKAENPGAADCTIEISSEDFQELVANPEANGMKLFFAGKLKVAGNQMLAMKLKALFALK